MNFNIFLMIFVCVSYKRLHAQHRMPTPDSKWLELDNNHCEWVPTVYAAGVKKEISQK